MIGGNTYGERVSTLWIAKYGCFAILADNQDIGLTIPEFRERTELTLGGITHLPGLIGADAASMFGARDEMNRPLTMNANGTVQGPDIGYRLVSGVKRSKRDHWFTQCRRTNL